MERLIKNLENLFYKEMNRREFLKFLGEFLIFLFILSLIPIKLILGKRRKIPQMKIKEFNPRVLYLSHNWAG
ncbi:MAG: hypothetical protein J7J54_06855 [Candidatus Omnitrophica bacterium]|nr:hypothetical protein [Candidatus Omnitrophota bacterium]